MYSWQNEEQLVHIQIYICMCASVWMNICFSLQGSECKAAEWMSNEIMKTANKITHLNPMKYKDRNTSIKPAIKVANFAR